MLKQWIAASAVAACGVVSAFAQDLPGLPPDALYLDPETAQLANPGSSDVQAANDRAIGEAQYGRGDFAAARKALERALHRQDRLLGWAHPESIQTAVMLSLTYDALGRPDLAIPLHNRAAIIRHMALGQNHVLTATSQLDLAKSYHKLGDQDEAIALSTRAFEALAGLFGPNDSRALEALGLFGAALNEAGDTETALKIKRYILAQLETTLPADDLQRLVAANDVATILLELGRFAEAEDMLRQVIRSSKSVSDPIGLSTVLDLRENYAVALSMTGKLEASATEFAAVLATKEAQLDPDSPELWRLRSVHARQLGRIGRVEEALALSYRDAETNRRIFGAASEEVTRALGNSAAYLQTLGRDDEALDLLRRILRDNLNRFGPDAVETDRSRNNLAGALIALGALDEAEALLTTVATRAAAPDPDLVLTALGNLAVIWGQTGREDKARQAFTDIHARFVAKNQLDAPAALTAQANLVGLGDRIEDAASLLARVDRGMGRRSETALRLRRNVIVNRLNTGDADGAALLARELVVDLDSLQSDAEGTSLLTRNARTAALADAAALSLTAAWRLRQSDPKAIRAGFEDAQRVHLGRTDDAIARAAVRLSRTSPEMTGALRAWDATRVELAAAETEWAEAQSVTEGDPLTIERRRATADETVRTSRQAFDNLRDEIEADFPDYFSLVNPTPVSLPELQGRTGAPPLLNPDEALVLFTPRRPNGFLPGDGLVFAITHDSVAVAQIPASATSLPDRISELHAQLDLRTPSLRAPISPGADPRPRHAGFDRQKAHDLYQSLFGDPDIADLLATKDRWLIAAQGPLVSLPFNALVATPPKGNDTDAAALRKTSWLGTTRSLSVLPSLTLLRNRQGPTQVTDRVRYVGIGDPAFRGETRTAMRSAAGLIGAAWEDRVAAVAALPRLPGTRSEVTSVARTYDAPKSAVFLGNDATETALYTLSQSGRLAETDVLHIATHGLLAGAIDGFPEPALALSPDPSGRTPSTDGLLTASEIAGLSLGVDWAILSACDTAAGSGPDADGLTGLARGFFYAGARALLVSHWAVDDDAAARLIVGAVSSEISGKARPDALRDAMMSLLSDTSRDGRAVPWSHPALWAPMQYIGAP